jgi:hypothetical protein
MLKTCYNPECRKMFSSSGMENLCHKCQAKEDEVLQAIKGYLEEHPGASVMDIHHGTEIPMEIIEHLEKAGRLNMVVLPKCTRCGQSITDNSSKTICAGCAKDMQNQFATELLGLKPSAAAQNLPSSGKGGFGGGGRRDDSGRSYGLGGAR